MNKPKLLFAVTEDWYFLSHRLTLAIAAREAGFEVHIATRIGAEGQRLDGHGFIVHPLDWDRDSINPLTELRTLWSLVRICRAVRPDVIHYVALKPILHGAFCQLFVPGAYAVNAVAGLGSIYSRASLKTLALRAAIRAIFVLLLRRQTGIVMVQNPDDGDFFKERGFEPRDGIVLVPGAGVDTERFRPTPEPRQGPVVVSVVARMLWDKGIGEVAEAARILKAGGTPVRVRLIGAPDPSNPDSVDEATLRQWHGEGLVEWAGPRSDIDAVWAESHIAVLASRYREGLPRALLEAAACARPMVASDIPGCRMLVCEGESGLLVPPGDASALAGAIGRLAGDAPLRARLGKRARKMVLERFSDKVINAAVLALYRAGLDKRRDRTE